MASTALRKVSFKHEKTESTGTYGTDPGAGSVALKELRHSQFHVGMNLSFVESDEIVSDRQAVEHLMTDFAVAGAIEVPWAYPAHDGFIDVLLRCAMLANADFTAAVTVGPLTNLTFAAAGNTITRASGSFLSDGVLKGGFLAVSGAATAANNTVWKITNVTATVITVSGGTLTNESAGASVTLKQSQDLLNGTTIQSIMTEVQFTDLSNAYEVANGLMVSSWGLNVPLNGLVKATFNMVGKSIASATATTGTGTVTAGAGIQFSSVNNADKVVVGGSVATLQSLQFTMDNRLRRHQVIGTLGATDIGMGSIGIEGSFTKYYATSADWDAAKAKTDSSLWISFQDSAGHRLIVELPALVFVSATRDGGDKDTDIIGAIGFRAKKSTATYDLNMIRVSKIA